MDLDDCRELARQISGKASISSLSLKQRWELIEMLKVKGASIYNPTMAKDLAEERQERPEDVYPARLVQWNKKFPTDRPGYATNEQLAWIQSLWELDFTAGRGSRNSLGKFIYRQTQSLAEGPVSDLAFLRSHHVGAVITPLLISGKKKHEHSSNEGEEVR
jgi:hypothetical protein